MKKGCLIVGLIALLGVGSCVYSIVTAVSNFPEYAQREVVYEKHKDVLTQINDLIRATNSVAEAKKQVADAEWPDKVVFIRLKEQEAGMNDGFEAFKRYAWSSNSFVTMNGSGYGKLGTATGEKQIVIINNSQQSAAGGDIKYDIYIEHQP